jgi:iron(III) transport system substrate-binding protein
MIRRFIFLALVALTGTIALISSFTTTPSQASDQQVNVYSYRQPFLVEPLFDAFTAETGISVKVIFAKKGLIERIEAEASNSPADVVLTTDIANLSQAAEKIAQPVRSVILNQYIPATARSDDDLWFGLTWRARIAYVSKERVSQESLTYAELADEKWRGKICLRSGQHPYNNALFAAMLAHLGEAEFRQWLIGLKANLTEKPSGNDRAQVRRVFGGVCDIAIGNTYYMGKMQTNEKNPEQKQWAASVRPVFPLMPNGGTHVNVSGMVMAKHAPNQQNAQKLMEFLVSAKAQKIYAEVNFEYPVRQDVAISPLVQSWGHLQADELPMDEIARLRQRASQIVDETGFNQGP